MNAQVQPAQELAPLTQVAEYSKTAAALAELREKYAGVVYEVTAPVGMKTAVAARAELRVLRVSLERTRVEIKAPALERCRLIDAEAKRITAELSALEDPIDAQIKAEEASKESERIARAEAERKRVKDIMDSINLIRGIPVLMIGRSAAEIEQGIRETIADDLSDYDASYLPQAQAAQAAALEALRTMLAERQRIDAERIELEAARAEQAKREEESRIERERLAKIEAARIAAERAAQEQELAEKREAMRLEEERAEAERAEQDRLAAKERARLASEAAEQRGREMKAAAEKRDAELAAQKKIDDAARAEREAAQRKLDAERAEFARKQDEAAERERIAAEAREAEALANVTLHDAATTAHAFLVELGQEHAQPTRMLAAALGREVQS